MPQSDGPISAWRERSASRLIRAMRELRDALEAADGAHDAARREGWGQAEPMALTLGDTTAPAERWVRWLDEWSAGQTAGMEASR